MTIFVVSVATVLFVSAACSLSEAALYSVRMPYIRQLVDAGSRAGPILARFKLNMETPITAILILNTAANTAGAAVAGAQARQIFGEGALFWFSAMFTLAVLIFSEVLPKVAGVTYRRAVARTVSVPIDMVARALYPLVWLSRQAAKVLQPGEQPLLAPEEEVHQFAAMSAEEGSILPFEAELVKNVLRLNDVQARDIMTPRTMVFKLTETSTARDVADEVEGARSSRIPIHKANEPENWTGWVLKEHVLGLLARDDFDTPLSALAKPLGYVPESAPGHLLLNEFLKRRSHILAVADEYGGIAGLVTLEDVMESLLGEEIVDETDDVVDTRAEARRRSALRLGGAEPPAAPSDAGPESRHERPERRRRP